ncbi:MAG: hypothetical protein LPK12_03210 [Rhodobacterales bacterium]|nr:hypothetical protein [Rhodobacterales bacterium]MDX5498947.1 hypothetical protein [Rhodobacterales bacterium]
MTRTGLDRWNQRFAEEGYLFGKALNRFLVRQARAMRWRWPLDTSPMRRLS